MLTQWILIFTALLMAGANVGNKPAETQTQVNDGMRACEIIQEMDNCN